MELMPHTAAVSDWAAKSAGGHQGQGQIAHERGSHDQMSPAGKARLSVKLRLTMLLGLHHVTALAGDAQATLDYYTQVLNLRLVKRTVNFDDPGTYHFYFGDQLGSPGSLLTFFPGFQRQAKRGAGQIVSGTEPANALRCAKTISNRRLAFWRSWDSRPAAPKEIGIDLNCRAARPASTCCTSRKPSAGKWARARFITWLFVLRMKEYRLEWRARLIEAGVRVSPVKDRLYFHSIYFREPGGALFEIATDGPGFLIDEPADSLGSSLCLPPWLEPARESIEARLHHDH